jgi:hypothetical protein
MLFPIMPQRSPNRHVDAYCFPIPEQAGRGNRCDRFRKLQERFDRTGYSDTRGACSRYRYAKLGAEMRLFLSLVALCGLCQGAFAETPDCKMITDPATRLTCYDKINPPVASYPIPLPKPTARPLSVPQSDGTGYVGSPDEDEALVNAKMNGICRGC